MKNLEMAFKHLQIYNIKAQRTLPWRKKVKNRVGEGKRKKHIKYKETYENILKKPEILYTNF